MRHLLLAFFFFTPFPLPGYQLTLSHSMATASVSLDALANALVSWLPWKLACKVMLISDTSNADV